MCIQNHFSASKKRENLCVRTTKDSYERHDFKYRNYFEKMQLRQANVELNK